MEFIDVHSHIIHNIDDGAKDIETSIELLKQSYEQGVKKLILTPHFNNRSEKSVSEFLAKRERRFIELKKEIKKRDIKTPELFLGSEVTITTDLSQVADIEKLAIEGTNYILLEMPYTMWQDWMPTCIFNLITEKNLIPIMAHIERYFDLKNAKKIAELAKMDVYFQINAASVLDKKQFKHILKLINNDLVYFLGSDAHSVIERPSYMHDAAKVLEKKISREFVHFLTVNAHLMLENKILERAEDIHVPKTNMSFLNKALYKDIK